MSSPVVSIDYTFFVSLLLLHLPSVLALAEHDENSASNGSSHVLYY